MIRCLRVLLLVMLAIPIVGLLTAMVGLAVARYALPASSCAVSEAAISTLELEKTKGSEVVSRLGCDGVHKVELDIENFRIETVSWRGDAWPYAVFEAYLINGVLHGTKKVWLNLKVTMPSSAASPRTINSPAELPVSPARSLPAA